MPRYAKIKKLMILFVAVCVILGSFGAAGYVVWSYFTHSSNPQLPTARVVVHGKTFEAEIANTTTTRVRGLSNRETLEKDEAMLFIFPIAEKPSFWMKDMRFPIDIVWIYKKRVVEITRDVPIPKDGTPTFSLKMYYPATRVDAVLEIAAGVAQDVGIAKGDVVAYELP